METTQTGIVIDIDDTLADTSLACATALKNEFTTNDCVVDDLLSEHGYPNLAPIWMQENIMVRYAYLLNDPAFIQQIPPTPKALSGIQEVCEIMPIAFYLTSRMPHLHQATTNWILSNGLPSAPVICRDPSITAVDWKVTFLATEHPNTFGLIDNELHVPAEHTYKGQLIELIRYKKMTPPNSTISICHSWSEVATMIRNHQQ